MSRARCRIGTGNRGDWCGLLWPHALNVRRRRRQLPEGHRGAVVLPAPHLVLHVTHGPGLLTLGPHPAYFIRRLAMSAEQVSCSIPRRMVQVASQ